MSKPNRYRKPRPFQPYSKPWACMNCTKQGRFRVLEHNQTTTSIQCPGCGRPVTLQG